MNDRNRAKELIRKIGSFYIITGKEDDIWQFWRLETYRSHLEIFRY